MSIMKVGKTLVVTTVLGVLLAASYGCDQQKPKCSTGRGTFIAKYTVVSGPPECAALKGEKIGVQTYNPTDNSGKQTPDLDKATLAIQSESMGLLVETGEAAMVSDPDPAHKPYALGAFATSEPSGDFCVAPTLSFAQVNLPAIKEDKAAMIDAQPKTEVIYEWANVKVYVTAAAYGTQFTADLLISTNKVSCTYKVAAMYPYVDCSIPDPVDEKKTIADPSLCAAEANPDKGHATGSGINPDFPVVCDAELKACVLTKPIPALN